MKTISASKARANFYKLLLEASDGHEPIQITGKKGNAILISEEDWRSIEETLHLTSIPGMKESIVEGMNEPLEDCPEELDW